MQTAELPRLSESPAGDAPAGRPARELSRRWAWTGLAVVLAGGLALRLWGIRQGLPYAYNTDEADHFVPRAVGMFAHGLDPHYFANPPGYTYLLHYIFWLAYGGSRGVLHAFAAHPSDLYTLARVVAAGLAVASLWLLYLTGARLLGRAAGLLAAAILAVAFLPVYYSHLALNDVPALAPLTLSLLGCAGVLRRGLRRDYVLAGAGLGLACATKYTAGIVVCPLAAAIAARFLRGGQGAGRRAIVGIVVAGTVALAAFLLANPYAVLDYHGFHEGLVRQSTLSAEAQGKLGAPRHGGLLYYLWSLTWGLGWVPALAALGGAVTVWRREPALGWLLVPAPILFLAFMGLQGRYFGRWLMPILPILCLLAALFTLQFASAAARRARALVGSGARGERPARHRLAGALAPLALAALITALLAQGLIHGVHAGLVLSRADTRNMARAWMLANVPRGSAIVVEPIAPDEWARETKRAAGGVRPFRWIKYPSLVPRLQKGGVLGPAAQLPVSIENYERTLAPALISFYEQHGYCWVVSGSIQSGRAFADPRAVPLAVAYYRALAARAEVVYRVSPFAAGRRPVTFGFDWSFDYYPLAYHRPGPSITVYRLHGGRCAR